MLVMIRTAGQNREATRLILEHSARARPMGLEAPDYNVVLWRYLDLPKLVYMLANRSLPLMRIDKFEDKWEGFSAPLSGNEYQGFFAKDHKRTDSERFEQSETLRKFYYASCWHISGTESDAMWKLYMSANEGLAICTTYQSLIYSLRKGSQDFLVSKVRYTKPTAGISMLLTCMTKREPFAHEKELRVIWHDVDAENRYRTASIGDNTEPPVKRLPCDLSQLIEAVYTSPKAGDWFAPVVRDLLKRYKLKDTEVRPSVLCGEPQWPKTR